MSENPYRLPRTVEPSRYELTLAPDLDAASFTGSVDVTLTVHERVDAIVLNAAELDIDTESARVGGTAVTGIDVDEETERATIHLAEGVEAGEHTLHLEFSGILNDKLRGFYRSTYTDDDGATHTIATTQFEATDARRAFPCFDEPDFKSTFAVTLVVAPGLTAVSNGPVEDEAVAADGRRTLRFAETMRMSTYLVAFIVGRLEATDPADVDGVPLRVVHVPGRERLTGFALEIGAFALRHFTGYYGIPYPAAKLDLVALPDFAAGAMENLGCVTFRETALLADRSTVTQAELARVADVVAHEIAHMWFGDLVTMRWWNGLWLNEAFATFMEVAAVDAFRPAWDRWTQFGLERSAAFDVDALASTRPIEYPVVSPTDAEGMFDVLTYEKGGSVLRMLEQYLGEEVFRDGIRLYLDRHSYANTETTDLWDALEEASGEPARRIMDTWIYQGGYPLVTASLGPDGSLRLSQHRFGYEGGDAFENDDATWEVPALVRSGVDSANGSAVHRVLLEGADATLPANDVGTGPVVVNAGGHGFYRVAYDTALLGRLSPVLRGLPAIERYAVIDDAWAAVLAGRTTAPEFLTLVRGASGETELGVWKLLAVCLGALDRLVEGEPREGLRRLVRSLIVPTVDRLGWDGRAGEPALSKELRGVALRMLGSLGNDEATQHRARELVRRSMADPTSVEPNAAAASVSIVAGVGTDEDYERYVERMRNAATPQDEVRFLYALAEFPELAQFERTLAMQLTDEVRTQNAPFVIGALIGHRDHGPVAWSFVKDHWDDINVRFPSNTIVRLLSGLRALSTPALAADAKEFFEAHPVPQGERTLRQHLEKQRVNVALRARESDRLAEALR